MHACARETDGNVWCWGLNYDGQCGGVASVPQSAPLQASISDVAHVANGYCHTCAVKSDGTVWCWGRLDMEYCGLWASPTRDRIENLEVLSDAPIQISGLDHVVQVSAGLGHTCALKSDGTVWCWGGNRYGQLGNGTTVDSASPVQASGLTRVASIATGELFTCALKTDQTVHCWGVNWWGQLADGTVTDRNKPTRTQLTNVVQLALGQDFGCVRKNDGSVWCWGSNRNGWNFANGPETRVVSWFPNPQVIPALTGALQLSLGGSFHCALVQGSNPVVCWGYTAPHVTYIELYPKAVSMDPAGLLPLVGVTDLANTLRSACATRTDGSIWCWGENLYGMLADGTVVGRMWAAATLPF